MNPSTCPAHPRYRAGCRGCQHATHRAKAARAAAKTAGTFRPLTPAGPARRHIHRLHNQHEMTWPQIARAAGVADITVRQIAGVHPRRVTNLVFPATADALLAVQPEPHRPCNMVPAVGSHRMLHALMAIGWPGVQLAGQLGVKQQRVGQILAQTRVTREMARRIRRVYNRLSMTPYAGPAAELTRRRAGNQGWPPPLAWDDDTIDDPAAKPLLDAAGVTRYDHAKVVLALDGKLPYGQLSSKEGEEVIRRLNGAGLNDHEIAEKLHADPDTIGRRRMRLGLPHRFDPCGRMGKAAS